MPQRDVLSRLLFVSPTYPDIQGNGLAMRAGMFIEALAQQHRVSLLVIPLFGERTPSSDAFIREHCAQEFVIQHRVGQGLWVRARGRFDKGPPLMRFFANQVAGAARALAEADFEVIHAFRLYTAPLAIALAKRASNGRRPQLHLDVDDIESRTHARLAGLYRLNSRLSSAEAEAQEATRYLEAERRLVPRFDRVYVCTQGDADRLESVAGEVRIMPNAIRPPVALLRRQTSHPYTLLFVGTLGYYPNEDAVRYFCGSILPLIRQEAARPFLVRAVGRGMPADFGALARIPELRLVGEVEDLDLEYAEADAVIVPIRAGGGTRIKVLEAFAHARPVVSTAIGMEGIDAEPGREFLLGDAAEAFAAQCLRLMADADLASDLSRQASSLLNERYSQQRINRLVAEWS